MIDIAGSQPFRKFKRVLTPDATVVIVGAKFPSNKGIGPLSHVIGTRLGAVGRSQTVKFFIAKIEKDDLEFLRELLETGKVKPVDRQALRAERDGRRSPLPGRGSRPREGHYHHVSVDADRLRDLTLELVEVESPTGDTAEVARLYGRRLEELGLEVELLDERFPATPIVVGRLRGGEPGPTVVLNGHLDTVPIPHEPPRRRRRHDLRARHRGHEGRARLRGRGGAGGRGRRGSFPGELVIVATGLHESPLGRGEDLNWLLERAAASPPTTPSSASSAARRCRSRTSAARRSRSRSAARAWSPTS